MLVISTKYKEYEELYIQTIVNYYNPTRLLNFPFKDTISFIIRMKRKDFIYIIVLMSFFFKCFFFNAFGSYNINYNNLIYTIKIDKNYKSFYYYDIMLRFYNIFQKSDEDIVVKNFVGEVSKKKNGQLIHFTFIKDFFIYLFEVIRLKFYFFDKKEILILLYLFLHSIYYTQKRIELSFKYNYIFKNIGYNFKILQSF